MAAKKRRLGDLYVVGMEVEVNDTTGQEPIVVWVQKLNPVESDTALRRGNAARASYLAFRKLSESEEYRAALSDVTDFASRNTLIDMVARDELIVRRMRVEAELGSEEEWSKDDYLQGLSDAWEGTPEAPGLKERLVTEPEDPEAQRVLEEMKRFRDQVDKRMEREREEVRADYANRDEDWLIEQAVQKVIENRAMSRFMEVFEAEQLFFSVREATDHKRRYFEDRVEVETLAPKVRRYLLDRLQSISVDRSEGKDLAGIPASSPSSEPIETAEVVNSFGPAVARP